MMKSKKDSINSSSNFYGKAAIYFLIAGIIIPVILILIAENFNFHFLRNWIFLIVLLCPILSFIFSLIGILISIIYKNISPSSSRWAFFGLDVGLSILLVVV